MLETGILVELLLNLFSVELSQYWKDKEVLRG
jgi:hypothetical protein